MRAMSPDRTPSARTLSAATVATDGCPMMRSACIAALSLVGVAVTAAGNAKRSYALAVGA